MVALDCGLVSVSISSFGINFKVSVGCVHCGVVHWLTPMPYRALTSPHSLFFGFKFRFFKGNIMYF
jgi:hypothetical protein